MELLKNIKGEILDTYSSEIGYVKSLSGEVQLEDYINLNGYVALLQNLTKTEYTEAMVKPLNYGLKNKNHLTMITIELDY